MPARDNGTVARCGIAGWIDKEVHGIMNNNDSSWATANARRLEELLEAAHARRPPRAAIPASRRDGRPGQLKPAFSNWTMSGIRVRRDCPYLQLCVMNAVTLGGGAWDAVDLPWGGATEEVLAR